MEYYSAMRKKNEILPFVTTWMEFKNIVVSEISQTEKDKYCILLVIWEPTKAYLVKSRQ